MLGHVSDILHQNNIDMIEMHEQANSSKPTNGVEKGSKIFQTRWNRTGTNHTEGQKQAAETHYSPREEPKGRLNCEPGYTSSLVLFIPAQKEANPGSLIRRPCLQTHKKQITGTGIEPQNSKRNQHLVGLSNLYIRLSERTSRSRTGRARRRAHKSLKLLIEKRP